MEAALKKLLEDNKDVKDIKDIKFNSGENTKDKDNKEEIKV